MREKSRLRAIVSMNKGQNSELFITKLEDSMLLCHLHPIDKLWTRFIIKHTTKPTEPQFDFLFFFSILKTGFQKDYIIIVIIIAVFYVM